MILIVSHEKDGHSRRVMEMLDRKGHPYQLFDLTCFPATASLSISYEKEKYLSTILERQTDITLSTDAMQNAQKTCCEWNNWYGNTSNWWNASAFQDDSGI